MDAYVNAKLNKAIAGLDEIAKIINNPGSDLMVSVHFAKLCFKKAMIEPGKDADFWFARGETAVKGIHAQIKRLHAAGRRL